MKKYFLVCFILTLLFPQEIASQNLEKKLENTYWHLYLTQGNADTSFFEPIKEQPKPNANYQYLKFEKNGKYVQHIQYGEDCIGDLSGTYKIEKSKITFTVLQNTISNTCKERQNLGFTTRSIVLKNNTLYLTPQKVWYDQAPQKKGDTIILNKEQVDYFDQEKDGRVKATDASRIPFDDGLYKLVDDGKSKKLVIFRAKNGYVDGEFIAKTDSKGFRNLYTEGNLVSEKRYTNDVLFYEKSIRNDVKKDATGHYKITITQIETNKSRNRKDSTITVYDNQKPVGKLRYENDKLISEMDFKNDIFKKYRSNGALSEMQHDGTTITYDYDGGEVSKEIYKKDSYELYSYGKLTTKKIFDKDKTTITNFDSKGNIVNTEVAKNTGRIPTVEEAEPNRTLPELSQEKFEYYKKLAN
ncbi:hypothetical protein [Soonwooa sp.]|uniref:hypothetical protein n=1 Tax=Soonwooa sp. TaxID=1938592 RepID=UPI0026229E95|nr:hypothetical protein [Soonwooa sp.]